MLPYQTRVFHSELEVAQARARLRAAVEPLPRAARSQTGRSFEGVVNDDTFRIHRLAHGRNSFRPELHGRIEVTTAGRARVVVSFRPHPLVAVFMVAWLVIVFNLVRIALAEAVETGETTFLWPSGGMLAIGLLMPLIAFPIEARKASRSLEEVFRAARP